MEKGKKIKELTIVCMGILCIFILGILNFHKLTTISIIGDEFGYWSAGAFFSGIDWTDATQCNAYYSWGYGIILAPLFILFDDTITMYQVAILLNIMMLIGSYLLCYGCINLLYKKERICIKVIVALVSTLYVSNLFYIQATIPETLLVLIFWMLCYLFILFIKYEKNWILFPMGFLTIYIYYVHQRTIAVTLSMVICILLFLLIEKKYTYLLFFISELCILIFVGELIKDSYQLYLWGIKASDVIDVNDVSGQVHKIGYLLTVEGIVGLIKGIIGKIFYLGTSTFFLFYIGVFEMIKMIKKKETLKDFKYLFLFICSSIFLSIIISSIFMVYYDDNLQRLMYGRYTEYVLPIIILIGLLAIWKKNVNKKTFHISIILYFFCALCILQWVNFEASNKDFNWFTIIAFSDGWVPEKNTYTLFFINILKTVLVGYMIYGMYLFRNKRLHRFNLMQFVIVIIWINTYLSVSEDILFSFRDIQTETNISLYKNIVENYDNQEIYYYEKEIPYKIDYMQFLLRDKKINVIHEIEEVETLENAIILTIIGSDEITNHMEQTYRLIGKSAIYYLWGL